MTSLRRFTSLCIGIAFLVMSYTGIILFLAPKGRVANWVHWELFGLDKTAYSHLHVTFMVLFLAGVVWHIYLNWTPLIRYLKEKSELWIHLCKELWLALAINLFFGVGTLFYWIPFEQFLDFQDSLKASWEKSSDTAPYSHAELSTLEAFASKTNRDISLIVSRLEAQKLTGVQPSQTIASIAKENNLSPARLLEMITAKPQNSTLVQGGGYGMLTLKESSVAHGFDLASALENLHQKGFNATESSTLKEVADALHVKPIELLEQLKSTPIKEQK